MRSNVNVAHGGDGHDRMDIDNMDGNGKFLQEKDDTEEKLEKLLFGDDLGFHDALKNEQDDDLVDFQMGTGDLEPAQSDDEDADSVDLEHIDDRDVSSSDSSHNIHSSIFI